MSRYVFDCETNGLLGSLTTIHCIVLYDLDNKEFYNFANAYDPIIQEYETIDYGIQLLQDADEIIGHNIVNYDIPAIQKIYPSFKPKGRVFDTLIASKLIYPDISDIDYREVARKRYWLPKNLIGKYSLKAFGYRLGELKGDYCEQEDCWSQWTPEMQRYCEQDVVVTEKLYNRLVSKGVPEVALELEQRFQQIIDLQINHGVLVDQDKLMNIAGVLQQKKHELEVKLKELFPARVQVETFIPKKNNKVKGYVKDVPFEKRTIIEFNPSSDAHVAERLIDKYGWKPKVKTPTGKPKVSEEILEDLPYPEIPVLLEYFKVTNALAKVYSGKTSLYNMLNPNDGRVRGNVNPFGTGTRRCSHSSPNMTQIPKNDYLPYIKPRECIITTPGYILVGCDASGLELRCLAHYMNDPDYTKEILSGDIHSKNQLAAGLPTRDNAKTFIYGFLYGAGDAKVGSITGKGSKEGKAIKAKFLEAIPSLGSLVRKVKKKAKAQGYLKSLDGAKVMIPQNYIALNYLLQGCGAIVMKKALITLYDNLTNEGWEFGREYAFILNCHDEIQAEVRPELAERLGIIAVNSIRMAGEYFNFRCPLDGEYKVGNNWAETH